MNNIRRDQIDMYRSIRASERLRRGQKFTAIVNYIAVGLSILAVSVYVFLYQT